MEQDTIIDHPSARSAPIVPDMTPPTAPDVVRVVTEDPPAALSIRRLDVIRGGRKVLGDISFDVPRGAIMGLVGLNGAGKTSLIKAVLGLAGEASGDIRIFGETAEDMRRRGAVACLPEHFRPPGRLRGKTYVRLMRGLEADPRDTGDALAIARSLDLDPQALERPVRTWSKGMCQKLGLAVTLAGSARLVVLDEPMSGLDPRARALLKTCLSRARLGGRTLLVCSHILADLDEIADRIAVIHDGRLLATGTTDEVRGRHATLERAFLEIIAAA
ncbi:MAG: ABC transporter ATP-binding protein [Geminicoccaceae bacterium]|nr:ABC transporter ATP-binding protein [Geminicoccaceae bacterium]